MIKVFKNGIKKIIYKILVRKKIDISDADIVSFDIFDTLIKRDVKEPTDVFELVEREYNFKSNNKINNFKKIRIEAEKKARNNTKKEEVCLNEIYNFINFSNKEKLMNLEIEIEKQIATKNLKIFNIYNECIKQKKIIFFTSDMYLPINVVKDILIKNGYKYYDKLYLSSETLLTKSSGSIFKKIKKENNGKIIHIGDSIKSDYFKAKINGIKPILIEKNYNNLYFKGQNNSFEYGLLSSFINNRVSKYTSPYEKFGYEVLGPILYSFTTWIHKQVIQNSIQKIYFLARDAKIIMDVYKLKYGEDIPLYYIYISRKSIILSSLETLEDYNDMINKLKSLINEISKVKDLFHVVRLDNLKYPYADKYLMDLTDEEKKEIFNIIKDELLLLSKKQKELFKKYMCQNQFGNNVALVDIGWNGTIQYYLEKIYDFKIPTYGYYYGIDSGNKYLEYDNLNRHGYLYENKNSVDYQVNVRLSIGLFETMFLSTEGTTLGYCEENNIIVPIQSEQTTSKHNSNILKMQETAKQFVKDVLNNDMYKIIDNFSKETFFENYRKMVTKPTKENIKMLKNIEYEDIYKMKLIESKSLLYYIFHLKQFYIDFSNSYCKSFFLKDVLKFNIPYKILKKLFMIHNKIE